MYLKSKYEISGCRFLLDYGSYMLVFTVAQQICCIHLFYLFLAGKFLARKYIEVDSAFSKEVWVIDERVVFSKAMSCHF